jgi:hypothetical protein
MQLLKLGPISIATETQDEAQRHREREIRDDVMAAGGNASGGWRTYWLRRGEGLLGWCSTGELFRPRWWTASWKDNTSARCAAASRNGCQPRVVRATRQGSLLTRWCDRLVMLDLAADYGVDCGEPLLCPFSAGYKANQGNRCRCGS